MDLRLKPIDYRVSTWLLMGALVHCVFSSLVPRNLASLAAIALLLYRFIRGYLVAIGHLRNKDQEGVIYGRASTRIPGADGTLTTSSSESIVVLVLGASVQHPNGRLSPGGAEINDYFVAMWKDAEAQRVKYGYLGNTPSMVAERGSGDSLGTRNGDDTGTTMIWLSYWKTLDGLHDFAHAKAHRSGWLWWERGAEKKYKHLGIMHELYEVPAGSWETISANFKPFAFGNAKFPVVETAQDGKQETLRYVSGLRGAKGKEWKSAEVRMGRTPGSLGSKKQKSEEV
ncbi:hypothetical protein BDV95DRAFT_492969 [Massariosphaeria phaeospora]|uniref:Uncharacterized protein n=1 Tax=Massariosphaeria phaeospora TaxID=100035 RepID=A0A7C8MPQ1_9PLEO|nr:hypothetical protein BDV95DRAFT_492969 [Massariosphaeria phaeospora]